MIAGIIISAFSVLAAVLALLWIVAMLGRINRTIQVVAEKLLLARRELRERQRELAK